MIPWHSAAPLPTLALAALCMQVASSVHSPSGLWLGPDTNCTIHGGSITCLSGCTKAIGATLAERARLQATHTLFIGAWGHSCTMDAYPGSNMDLTCCSLLASRSFDFVAVPQDRPGQGIATEPGSSLNRAVRTAASPLGSSAHATPAVPRPPCNGLLLEGRCKLVGRAKEQPCPCKQTVVCVDLLDSLCWTCSMLVKPP